MLNDVVRLEAGGREIYLVGTAHVSKESVELVKETIEEVNPDVVAVELCQQRHDAILDQRRWNETEINRVIKEDKTYLFLMQLMLTNFQRKIGDELDVKPGSEMIEALRMAGDKNIRVALVDRDIKVSLKRALNKTSLTEKYKLLYAMVSGMFDDGEESTAELMEQLKDKDIVTNMVEELGKEIPSFKEVLLDERDRYIADKIIDIDAERIVAVLGAGHIKGIRDIIESEYLRLGEDRAEEIRCLDEVSESRSIWRYIGYMVPALIVLVVVAGFMFKGEAFVMDALWKWILINGSLSALGVIIARGHVLSVITAFIAAPITSMNPLLAAGWFAGLMEAHIRKPKVKDFEGLLRLNSVRDYWGNRVTRIFLVIVLANLGSGVGTYIAGLSIFAGIYEEIIHLLPI